LKGLISVVEAQGPVVVQGVHHVMHPPTMLDRWPDADRRTRIVLIVQGEAGQGLEARWSDALPRLYAVAATVAA
jgi:G3E family GTPase